MLQIRAFFGILFNCSLFGLCISRTIKLSKETMQYVDVEKNSNVTLICPTSGATMTTSTFINWYKNGEKITWFKRKHLHVTQENWLHVHDMHFKDSGLYQCRLLNGSGHQKLYNLTMNVKSTIESNTNRTTINENADEHPSTSYEYDELSDYDEFLRGDAPKFIDDEKAIQKTIRQLEKSVVHLNCKARGFPTPDIIWFKNDKVISEDDIGNVRESMVLTISDLSKTDTGNYTCQVTNQHGKINRYFQLKILETLIFDDEQDTNLTLAYGMNALFKCKIKHNFKHADAKTHIMWFREEHYGINLALNINMSVEINGKLFYNLKMQSNLKKFQFVNDNSYLIVKNLDFQDIGHYLCVANNTYGYSYRLVYLNVSTASQIDTKNPTHFSYNALISISVAIVVSLGAFLIIYACKNSQLCNKDKHNSNKALNANTTNSTKDSNKSTNRMHRVTNFNQKRNTHNNAMQGSMHSTPSATKSLSKISYGVKQQYPIGLWSDINSDSSGRSGPYAKILNV